MTPAGAGACDLDGPPPYDLSGCDLRGRTLAGKDLTDAKLTRANLEGTDFRGVVSMARADLSGAVMGGGTTFDGCDVSATVFGANPVFGGTGESPTSFAGATLSFSLLGMAWRGLNLRGATIRGLPPDLSGLRVVDSDLSGLDLSGRSFTSAHLSGVVANGTSFRGCILDDVVFQRGVDVCDLTGADLSHASASNAVFDTSTLTDADFTMSRLDNVSFLNARMDGTKFTGVDVTSCAFSSPPMFFVNPDRVTSFRGATVGLETLGTRWSGLDLTGATILGLEATVDLTDLEARHAVLTGIDLSHRTLDRCDLSGALVGGADFTGASMNGARLSGVSNAITVTGLPPAAVDVTTTLEDVAKGHLDSQLAAVLGRYAQALTAAEVSHSEVADGDAWTVTGRAGEGVVAYLRKTKTSATAVLPTRFDLADLTNAMVGPLGTQASTLKGSSFRRTDLTGASLDGADLDLLDPSKEGSGADFSDAVLINTGLSQANLTGANLTGGVALHQANLSGATLKGADLTGVQAGSLSERFRIPQSHPDYVALLDALTGNDTAAVASVFSGHQEPLPLHDLSIQCKVQDRTWQLTAGGAEVSTVMKWQADDGSTFLVAHTPTSAANLTGAFMPGAKLVNANLYGVQAPHLQHYEQAGQSGLLDGAILDGCMLASANLANSSIVVTSLHDVDLSYANLVHTSFKGADLTGNVSLAYANLQGADFTGTRMNGVALTGAAVAVSLGPTAAGVFLFDVLGAEHVEAAVAELKSARSLSLAAQDSTPSMGDLVLDLDQGLLASARKAFQAKGVVLVPDATVEKVANPEDADHPEDIWRIHNGPGGSYIVWSGLDDDDDVALVAHTDLPVVRSLMKQGGGTGAGLRWQATVRHPAGPGGTWLIDNDGDNPENFDTGYVQFMVVPQPGNAQGLRDPAAVASPTPTTHSPLAFYGTVLRITTLVDSDRLEYSTLVLLPTILDRTGTPGDPQGDGSSSVFGPDTICPNGRSVRDNRKTSPPTCWEEMLRAPAPPRPPDCVPGARSECPAPSPADIGRTLAGL